MLAAREILKAMEGKLIGVEKLEDGSDTQAEVYEVGTNHFRARYLDASGAEVYPASEHVGTTFMQAWQEISARLRGWR